MTGDVWVVLPLACLVGGAFTVYLVARLLTSRNDLLALLTALVFAAALVALVPLQITTGVEHLPAWGHFGEGGAFLRADPGALIVAGVTLGLGLLVTLYSGRYLALDQRYETYYPLLLLLVTGLVGMVLAADLFNLYMFCELMSIAAYVLVAFRRHTDTAIEAGFKYLVMGSVGTVTILLGISFVYREMGTLALPPPSSPPWEGSRWGIGMPGLWMRAGVACFLVGMGIKSAIVPLHTWLPDAHGRAPSSISAMLSGIIVQSAFYALLKISLGLGFPARDLGTLLIMLSLLNMTLGNGLALVQTHTKRLLAYSTIAQMGYIMLSIGVGLRYGVPGAIQAGFLLILAHAAMKGLAFLCQGVCHFYCDATLIVDLREMAARLPLVAVAFSLALAGLAGVPPLAGFTAKWFILMGILRSSGTLGYVGLAVFLLNSLLALGYYLPLIGTLFTPQTSKVSETLEVLPQIRISPWMALPIVALGALVLAIGLYPGPWLEWTADVGVYLLAASVSR
ncbi:MAG: proton-conducting transporter membrane subunit [Chloroflexota bacterium]|nr:proton-conducting transporter membrane subunit [Chloroflexota bacterium]